MVLIGALTNRAAVSSVLRGLVVGGVVERCTLVACGERWTSVSCEADSLRPSVEDLVGVGAIADLLLDLRLSVEAELAVAAYRAVADRLGDALSRCVSGRELIESGFRNDVGLAVAVDTSTTVPIWDTRCAVREFTAEPLV